MVPVSISPQFIFPRADAREISRETVRALAASISEIGIINPLRVRPLGHSANGIEGETYEVCAGNHRLKAALSLGLDEVPCVVVDDDDLLAELAMIDENLCRAELSPADRARQTARRKAIYLELHPETAQHVAGGKARQETASDNLSFAADTAAASGKTERTVQRDAERGEKVCEAALNMVRGTALDTGAYLDKLKKVDPDEQVETVQRALAGIARQQERDRAEAQSKRNQSRIESDVSDSAAKELARIFAEHIPADLWDAVKANLHACKRAADIAKHLTNITGHSVMDEAGWQ